MKQIDRILKLWILSSIFMVGSIAQAQLVDAVSCEVQRDQLDAYFAGSQRHIQIVISRNHPRQERIIARINSLVAKQEAVFRQNCPEETLGAATSIAMLESETQLRCEAEYASLQNYIGIVEANIQQAFATRSRYRFATKRRLEKLIFARKLEFAEICPNFDPALIGGQPPATEPTQCETMTAAYEQYKQQAQATIQNLFETRSRYRFAIKRQLERIILQKGVEVAEACAAEAAQ